MKYQSRRSKTLPAYLPSTGDLNRSTENFSDCPPPTSPGLTATVEDPSRIGREILGSLIRVVGPMRQRISARLGRFFPTHPSSAWWSDVEDAAHRRFVKGQATDASAGSDAAVKRITYLWM